MEDTKAEPTEGPAAKNSEKDAFQFDKSLKELKDLRSQLHYAADYCESNFLNSNQKHVVIENTRDYIYRAVITVVDHLGSASANFDALIVRDIRVTEAEIRLDSLRQRLLACEQYAQKSALADLRWNPRLPRHRSRYLCIEIPNHDRSLDIKDAVKSSTGQMKTSAHVAGETDTIGVISDTDKLKLSKVQNTAFDFQQKTCKPRRMRFTRASFQGRNNLLLLFRGAKRPSKVS